MVPDNVGARVMAGTVKRIEEFLQLSEQQEWSFQVFYLKRFYRPSGDDYETTDLENSHEGSGSHEW